MRTCRLHTENILILRSPNDGRQGIASPGNQGARRIPDLADPVSTSTTKVHSIGFDLDLGFDTHVFRGVKLSLDFGSVEEWVESKGRAREIEETLCHSLIPDSPL